MLRHRWKTAGGNSVGHRLSKIVTRTGDAGMTGLGDGSRIAKHSTRIEAIGAVDELNSTLGCLLAEHVPPRIALVLAAIQHDLFDLGGELSIPGHVAVTGDHILRLERAIESFNADLPPLKEFILPGGTRAASIAHIARTVCRRAERAVVALAHDETAGETVGDSLRRYLNRLSDLLFIVARTLNQSAGHPDIMWQKNRSRTA